VIVIAACVRFGRVSGEVFLVDSDGKVHAAPGAFVTFYGDDSKRNWGTFMKSDQSRRDKARDEAFKTRKEGETPAPEVITEAFLAAQKSRQDLYDRLAEDVEQSFCMETSSQIDKFFEDRLIAEGTSDREGRFSVDLQPGWLRPREYTIVVEGQAGQQNAIWLEWVFLRWRSEVRPVNPYCTYTAFNPQH
jgi:hypothetical protein